MLIILAGRMPKHLIQAHENENSSATLSVQTQSKKRRNYQNSSMIVKVETLKKCQVCGVMKTSRDLSKHMHAHSIVGKQVCPLCPYNCRSRTDLKVHITIKHPDNYEPVNQFICTLCPDKTIFESIDDLRAHMENIHSIKQTPRLKRKKPGFIHTGIGDLTKNSTHKDQDIIA